TTRYCGVASLLIRRSKLYFTSAAITGLPSWKRAAGLSRNVADSLSGATSTSSASNPYAVVGSSIVPVSKVSNISSLTPGAVVPLIVNGLYLSKFVTRVPGVRTKWPPFGASGFTHSKCLKPGGYLMSPNCAYAWAAQAPGVKQRSNNGQN